MSAKCADFIICLFFFWRGSNIRSTGFVVGVMAVFALLYFIFENGATYRVSLYLFVLDMIFVLLAGLYRFTNHRREQAQMREKIWNTKAGGKGIAR